MWKSLGKLEQSMALFSSLRQNCGCASYQMYWLFSTNSMFSSKLLLHPLYTSFTGKVRDFCEQFFLFTSSPPCVILQNSCDLTAVDYADESNVLSEEDIYIGDNTAALLLHLKENEGEVVGQFYQKVIQFYQAFVKKQLKSFEFQSSVLRCLTFLDPDQAQRMPLST